MASITVELNRNFHGPDGNRYRALHHGKKVHHDMPRQWFERPDPTAPEKTVLILPPGARIIDHMDSTEEAVDPGAIIKDMQKEIVALRKQVDLLSGGAKKEAPSGKDLEL